MWARALIYFSNALALVLQHYTKDLSQLPPHDNLTHLMEDNPSSAWLHMPLYKMKLGKN
jgi:hypothetical protein